MSLPAPDPPRQLILDGYILPSKYILGPATKILLLLATTCGSTLRIIYHFIYVLPLCDYTSKMSIFYCAHSHLTAINLSLKVLLILFGFNVSYFKKFISNIGLLSLETDHSADRAIRRNRRLNLVIIFIHLIVFTISFCTYIHYLGTFKFTFIFISQVFIRLSESFFLNMICNICICLKAAFNQVNSQIAALNQTSEQFFDHSFNEIRNLRQRYSYAVRSTQNAEKLFRYFITLFYIEYFTFNIINIVRLFGPKTHIDSFWLLFMSADTVILLLLTYNLVSVNNLSRQGLEDLYEISFKLNSFHSYHENDIFIARMALSDVGFTFANLFTISNSFITSLFTLSLTIIIALASFIY